MFKSHTWYKVVLTLVVLVRAVTAEAATNTALLSGSWETGSNWSTGAAPTATDNVIIPLGVTITVTATGDVCGSLNITLGTLHINANESLSIGGSFTNTGTFIAFAGSTLTFNGAANSVISGGGTYTVASTVVMNMGSAATTLDVQDANFISGVNSGGKYYFTFTKGTWIMDNTGTLGDSYNSGSTNALTIPFGVTIQSNSGTMNLAKNGTSNNVLLSGELYVNGGIVQVQLGQAKNSGQDFRYSVNGGTPQLYVSSGTLYIGAGFNAKAGSDYIDFEMTGGTMVLAESGYSDAITFQLANNVGGKTLMSAGLIILQDACNASAADLDMGGANVAATLYSVTGGTVQLGYVNTQAGASYFGVNAEPATNYPNITFQAGVAKSVSAWNNGVINMLSLYINSNMTFDASGFSTVNIMNENGAYAFDNEGTYTTGTSTMEFSGGVNQVINNSAGATINFYNLQISNTSGNVTLNTPASVSKKLTFTSGKLDASKYPVSILAGSNAVSGATSSSYVIVGNGVAPTTGYMSIAALPGSSNTLYPVGTASYYLPAQINPEGIANTAYSVYVFTPATVNAKSNGATINAAVLANMYNAVWNISQTAGTAGGGLILGWAATGDGLEGSTFAGAGTNIGIAQYQSAWGWEPATGTGNVATRSATSSFTTFSQYAITTNTFVLPVTISGFNATLETNNKVQLTWSASDDMEISNFIVERSTDGTTFSPIGTVEASNTQSSYSLIDANPVSGTNYYRLLTQTTEGSSLYSPIRTVNLSSVSAGITVYPIPATTTVNVSIGNTVEGVSVRLISQTGQVLKTATATTGNQVITMDISGYPAGAYFVQVIGQNTILQTSTVVKL